MLLLVEYDSEIFISIYPIFGMYIYVFYLITILIFGMNVYAFRRSWVEWGQSKITSYSESSLSAVAIVWWASSILSPILTKVRTSNVLAHCTYYCTCMYAHLHCSFYCTCTTAVPFTVCVHVLLFSLELRLNLHPYSRSCKLRLVCLTFILLLTLTFILAYIPTHIP